MKKRIGVIGLKGLPAFVGAGTVGENIIKQLSGEFEFYVYSNSTFTNLKSGPYNGVYQKVIWGIPLKRLNGFWYYLVSALHARFKGDFDLIHLHNSFAAFTLFILKDKYPVILTTHGGFNIVDKWKKYAWFWRYNTNRLVRKADHVCCVSLDEKRKFKELLHLDVQYIPNGINLVNKELLPTIELNEPYIFFGSGRIIRTKGLHDLIVALHQINYSGLLVIAGDLDQIKSYKIEVLNLIGNLNVKFLGLIKEKDRLLKYMSEAKFLVYPTYVEAMSMMLLEAVAVDCPIICSDIVQNKDILNDEEALFFKTGDPIDLAGKLEWALRNSDKMNVMAKQARVKFLKEFNWTAIAEQYKELYLKFVK